MSNFRDDGPQEGKNPNWYTTLDADHQVRGVMKEEIVTGDGDLGDFWDDMENPGPYANGVDEDEDGDYNDSLYYRTRNGPTRMLSNPGAAGRMRRVVWSEGPRPGSSYSGAYMARQPMASYDGSPVAPRPITYEQGEVFGTGRQPYYYSPPREWRTGVPVVRGMRVASSKAPMLNFSNLGSSEIVGLNASGNDLFVLRKEINYKMVPVSAGSI